MIEPGQFGVDREVVRAALEAAGIEARPVWKPMHLQPVFAGYRRVGGAVAVGTSETVRYLRDSLLTYLRNRGSAESVAALQRAGRELGADWMNWHVADAKNVGFRIAWNPITPSELLLLASARNRPNTWAANSLLVVALTVLINVLTGLITPSALHVQTKAFLVIGTILAILALIEPMYEARRSLLPLWIILLAADAAGYAIFRYFSA